MSEITFERDRHDVDIGGVPYMVMVENLEKNISPFTIIEFIHQELSITCQVSVSPSLSWESFTRATMVVDNKRNMDKLTDFLESPDRCIISSQGRPWVVTEKGPVHDIPLASVQALMANYQTVLQSRTRETSNVLKVVLAGTEKYKTATQLKDLVWEFINHQSRLHQRLLIEEEKMVRLVDEELDENSEA